MGCNGPPSSKVKNKRVERWIEFRFPYHLVFVAKLPLCNLCKGPQSHPDRHETNIPQRMRLGRENITSRFRGSPPGGFFRLVGWIFQFFGETVQTSDVCMHG